MKKIENIYFTYICAIGKEMVSLYDGMVMLYISYIYCTHSMIWLKDAAKSQQHIVGSRAWKAYNI